jgi:hypothetical protein
MTAFGNGGDLLRWRFSWGRGGQQPARREPGQGQECIAPSAASGRAAAEELPIRWLKKLNGRLRAELERLALRLVGLSPVGN